MATRLAIVGLLLGLSSPVSGQVGRPGQDEAPVTVDDLGTPAWPAFTLLGVTPTDIAQPSTPRALAIALLSVVQDGRAGVLPSDFALELAPYWLFEHPDLSFDQYTQPGIAQSMAQSMSVSVAAGQATMPFDGAVTAEATDLAVGARTTIVSGRPGRSFDRAAGRMRVLHTRDHVLVALREAAEPLEVVFPQDIRRALDALTDIEVDVSRAQYAALRREIERDLAAALTDSVVVRLRNALDRLILENVAAIERLSLEMQRVGRRRVGLHVETAGGVVLRAHDGSPVRLIRSGAWMTAGITGQTVSLIGLARMLREQPQDLAVEHVILDVGLKGTLNAGALNLGTEGVVRRARSSLGESRPTWRVVATFDYRVSRDVTLSASFGKDYADDRIRRRNVVVGILGVNFSFGESPDFGLR